MLTEATLTSPGLHCERLLWWLSWRGYSFARVLRLTQGTFFFSRLSHVTQACETEHQSQVPCCDFTMSSWTTARNIGSVLPVHSIFCAGLNKAGTQNIRNWSVLIEKELKVEIDGYISLWLDIGHDCCRGSECTIVMRIILSLKTIKAQKTQEETWVFSLLPKRIQPEDLLQEEGYPHRELPHNMH